MRRLALPLALLLSACTPGPMLKETKPATRAIAAPANDVALPAMQVFGPRPAAKPRVSNTDLARDFLDLSFELESGRALPVFTRAEGPITLRVAGRPPASMGPDLTRLLHRLRVEAGIEITRTDAADATIVIEAVSGKAIRNALPDAACFVVPNVTSLRDYLGARRAARTNWTTLRQRDRLAVFVPNDTSPQELRDCLHEELAQAIGPLNDLYRLPDSVFNDDNVHGVLTGHDMLILRAYYDPALRSGMTREEVARRLPAILTRINPEGDGRPARIAGPTPTAWAEAIRGALHPEGTADRRVAAAKRALRIAEDNGWQDHRSAFAHYAAGRLAQQYDPVAAMMHFRMADAVYARAPGLEIHRAYLAAQMAAHGIRAGDGMAALEHVMPHLEVAADHENAALLSTLLLLRAEALDLLGRTSEADGARLDSLGWARYAFGADWAVRAKVHAVAALNPLKGRG